MLAFHSSAGGRRIAVDSPGNIHGSQMPVEGMAASLKIQGIVAR